MATLISSSDVATRTASRPRGGSGGLGWNNIEIHSYRQPGQDVELPGLRDFILVAYRNTVAARMARRCGGRWEKTVCEFGDISLQTRVEPSRWKWCSPLEVRHVYLSEQLISNVAQEVTKRDSVDVRLKDKLKIVDPVMNSCIESLWQEVQQRGSGGRLYVDALGTQLAVHLLRHYSTVSLREPPDRSCLSPAHRRYITEYIEDQLHRSLRIDALARTLNLGPCTFMRRFRKSLGVSPHAYVVQRRVERACRLLRAGTMPVKAIASTCGFADQSHMTRVFRARLNTTPGALDQNPERYFAPHQDETS